MSRVARWLAWTSMWHRAASVGDELDSLRTIVTMLGDLPVEAPGRSFTMAAPPPKPVSVRPSPLLRAPQWVYAGAASVAAIILVVLVSADATGLLAPEEPDNPLTVAAPKLEQLESEVINAGAVEQDSAEPGPEAAAPATSETAVEASPPSIAMAAEAEPMSEPAAPIAIEDQEMEDQSGVATAEDGSQTTAPEERTRVSEGQDSEQVLASQTPLNETSEQQQGATAKFWRVLEGLAGALGLVFLAGLAVRWKISRRTGRV